MKINEFRRDEADKIGDVDITDTLMEVMKNWHMADWQVKRLNNQNIEMISPADRKFILFVHEVLPYD